MTDKNVSLTAKIVATAKELKVHYRIANQTSVPILVFNRLNHYAPDGDVLADDEEVYRFVCGPSLRLLLGAAPLPHDMDLFARNEPLVTRVEPFDQLERRVALPLPVREYSIYFSSNPEQYVAGKVEHVELFATYIEATGVEAVPWPEIPGALWPQYGENGRPTPKLLRSGQVALPLDVLVNNVEFTRMRLPEDKRDWSQRRAAPPKASAAPSEP